MRWMACVILVCGLACGDDDASSDAGGDSGRLDSATSDGGGDDAGGDDAGEDAGEDDAGEDDASAGDAGATDAPTRTSCDTRAVTCRRAEPECGELMVPEIIDNCYGECIPIGDCVCAGPEDCPRSDEYTCNMSTNRCTPFL